MYMLRNEFFNLTKIPAFFGISFVLTFILTVASTAAPSTKKLYEEFQPNGQKVKLRNIGDAFANVTTDQNNNVVLKDSKDGYFKYATLKNDNLSVGNSVVGVGGIPQNVVKAEDAISLKLENFKKENPDDILEPSNTLRSSKSVRSFSDENSAIASQKILVLLVNFQDRQFETTEEEWVDMFFGESESVNDYYDEISEGKFSYKPVAESYGTSNDGIVSVTLDYNHPNTASETDERNKKIVKDSLLKADSFVDFTQFDTNDDNILTSNELNVVTIIAGYDTSASTKTPSVWAHKWVIDDFRIDGLTFGEYYEQYDQTYFIYGQFGELYDDSISSIGTICHELGHLLGLVDLYDRDYSSSGIGMLSLMSSGNFGKLPTATVSGMTPTHMDPWSKMQLGWVNPKNVTYLKDKNESETFHLHAAGTNDYNVLRIDIAPNQYFLIENRQFTGYDRGLEPYISSGGIAIYHIDELLYSIGKNNDDEKRKLVDLEEANQQEIGFSLFDLNSQFAFIDTDPLYYVGHNDLFNQTTDPNSSTNDNRLTNVQIKVLSESAEVMEVLIQYNDQELDENSTSNPSDSLQNRLLSEIPSSRSVSPQNSMGGAELGSGLGSFEKEPVDEAVPSSKLEEELNDASSIENATANGSEESSKTPNNRNKFSEFLRKILDSIMGLFK